MKSRIVLIVGAAALLGGCQVLHRAGTAPKTTPTFTCDRGHACDVTVTVSACDNTRISVNRPALGLRHNNQNAVITWRLAGDPQIVFAADGVFFKPASTQFENAVRADRTFTWVGKNSTPGEFAYGIRVTRNGAPCALLDPSVINDVPDAYQ
jgi:hypothetical protein